MMFTFSRPLLTIQTDADTGQPAKGTMDVLFTKIMVAAFLLFHL